MCVMLGSLPADKSLMHLASSEDSPEGARLSGLILERLGMPMERTEDGAIG
jgi:hypothetical protein